MVCEGSLNMLSSLGSIGKCCIKQLLNCTNAPTSQHVDTSLKSPTLYNVIWWMFTTFERRCQENPHRENNAPKYKVYQPDGYAQPTHQAKGGWKFSKGSCKQMGRKVERKVIKPPSQLPADRVGLSSLILSTREEITRLEVLEPNAEIIEENRKRRPRSAEEKTSRSRRR